jgi:hypothetical protein
MQPRAEARSAATALLTIHSGDRVWALPSLAVASVEPFSEDGSDAPLDVLALLGAAPAAGEQAARVVVLSVQGQRLRLLVRGHLTLTETAAVNLLPLPAAVQSASPRVSHVALVDGKPALFVVSPERLLQAFRVSAVSSPPIVHDSARGSSC